MENTFNNKTQLCLMDYLNYAKITLFYKPIIFIIPTFISSVLLMIADKTAVNASFVSVYIILSFSDWFSGIVSSRVEKQEFKSRLFYTIPINFFNKHR